MFAKGEYVVHPGQGVCQVADVVEKPDGVYKLAPVGQRRPIIISFPIASEDRLRPVLTESEAKDLIDEYLSIELDEHTERSGALEEEYFRGQIRQGSCRDSVKIAKTFRARIAQAVEECRKPPVAYDRILKEATSRSLSELAIALDLAPDEVAELFAAQES